MRDVPVIVEHIIYVPDASTTTLLPTLNLTRRKMKQ